MKTFLLRKESFGGTLFLVKAGKRAYISRDEFQLIEDSGVIPKYLAEEMGGVGETKIIYPCLLPKLVFSSPDIIFLEVTRGCNLACKHCFNDSGRKIDEEIELRKQIEIIKECAKSGVQEIRFTGGEPMIPGYVYDLIQEASQNNLRVSIGTNGTLMTSGNAMKLSACGLNMAIDGTNPFDSYCQKGYSYEKKYYKKGGSNNYES